MSKKKRPEIEKLVDKALMLLVILMLVLALWMLLDGGAEAQGPYPYVTWGRGSAPWYHYAPGYKVRAGCFNNYGAHVPCRAATYTVWR